MASRGSFSKSRLVLATLNAAKARELLRLLGDLPFEVSPLIAFPGAHLPPEGERSYTANALDKARATVRLTGAMALADDSGLEVDALGSQPGVASSRYGGEGLSDRERCARLLHALREVPLERRSARFRCVIAVADPRGRERVTEGVVEGFISPEPRGTGGFGYDAIFFYPPLNQTFAELPPEVKGKVSHRGRALALARDLLLAWPEG
ncbi:MAG: non-canonical purine NTP pyrophosphatase, partial [Candidatus Methylomirabilia bacterium]